MRSSPSAAPMAASRSGAFLGSLSEDKGNEPVAALSSAHPKAIAAPAGVFGAHLAAKV
ncbi:MAG: hypothetical protein ACHQDY_00985 [Solirubrobacterales bacterium]